MHERKSQRKALAIAGPTGSGESTITKKIIEAYPQFSRTVTATTRAPRAGEEHERDYYFLSREEFERALENGDIVEHTYVPNRDVYYGTYKPDLEKRFAAGKTVIINPDLVGAKFYKKQYGATTIFIMPGSMDELRGRFRDRDASISDEEVEKRIVAAQKEVDEERPFYDYEVVNANGKLDEAFEEVCDILRKEHYID